MSVRTQYLSTIGPAPPLDPAEQVVVHRLGRGELITTTHLCRAASCPDHDPKRPRPHVHYELVEDR